MKLDVNDKEEAMRSIRRDCLEDQAHAARISAQFAAAIMADFEQKPSAEEEAIRRGLEDQANVARISAQFAAAIQTGKKVNPHEFIKVFDEPQILQHLQQSLTVLRSGKPTESGEKSRRYAVTIADMEKVLSYFKVMVVDHIFEENESE